MRCFTLFSIILLAGTAAAQQQTDSTPPAQGWIRLNTGTTAGFSAVDPHGSDTVYASGSTLLRSIDGGTSWQSLPNPPSNIGILAYLDDSTGFLVAPNDTIYKTTNSQNWNAVGLGYMGTVIFHEHDTGWTFNQAYLSRTIDGGNSWQGIPVRCKNEDNAIAFAPDGKHGFIMGPAGPWTWRTNLGDVSFTAADLARTTDGGATWSDIYTDSLEALQRSNTDGFTFVPWGVSGLAALSQSAIIAVGVGIAKSTDGGDNWDTILTSQIVLYAVTFPDSLHGTAVGGDGLILHTSDGGTTWQSQNSGLTSQALYSVHFSDSLNGYASGSQGVVIKTNNGGLSWVRISLLSNQLQGDSYPNPSDRQTTLSYRLPSAQQVSLRLQNMTGASVQIPLYPSFQTQGEQNVPINTSSFPSGTYTYVLQTEKYFATGKFEVIH